VNSYGSATPQQQDISTAVRPQSENYLRFGPFHLDVARRELFRDGLRVKVQSKVIEALLILIENRGQIITRETLRERLWPGDTQMNYDANVNTTVNKLRHALGDSHDLPLYVETIPRRGYTFIAKTEFVEQPPVLSRERSAPAAGPSESTVHPSLKDFFGGLKASKWFAAGAISLFVGAMLFGAAVVLFVYRAY
jgi:DNA-binding winged helix-turn-helix (wHTH) protein